MVVILEGSSELVGLGVLVSLALVVMVGLSDEIINGELGVSEEAEEL